MLLVKWRDQYRNLKRKPSGSKVDPGHLWDLFSCLGLRLWGMAEVDTAKWPHPAA